MDNSEQKFPKDSAGRLISTKLLTVNPGDLLGDVIKKFDRGSWSMHFVFVLDNSKRLLGMINLIKVPKEDLEVPVSQVMFKPKAVVSAYDDQSKAVILAVREGVSVVPVLDHDKTFLGAIPPNRLIKVMHVEHVDEAMMVSGVHSHGGNLFKSAAMSYGSILRSRLPWLMFGAVAGLGLGMISSLFEETLSSNVALAYFVPVVAYIADSVGTQAEAIAVRSLALFKLSFKKYIWRELVTGVLVGMVLGVFSGIGAVMVGHSAKIGLVVGLSLLCASTIASVLAAVIPIVLKKLGKDPALGSGPLATALQDILSVIIYFIFATIIIR